MAFDGCHRNPFMTGFMTLGRIPRGIGSSRREGKRPQGWKDQEANRYYMKNNKFTNKVGGSLENSGTAVAR